MNTSEVENIISISEVLSDKKNYLNLLLTGDEQEDMIDRYLDSGRLFIGILNDKAVSCIVVVEQPEDIIEIKNLAVDAEYRKNGIGTCMIRYIETLYPDKVIQTGTGETPSTLRFYISNGFEYSHRIHNFFTDNYNHPIIEEGVLLQDMVYLRKHIHPFDKDIGI